MPPRTLLLCSSLGTAPHLPGRSLNVENTHTHTHTARKQMHICQWAQTYLEKKALAAHIKRKRKQIQHTPKRSPSFRGGVTSVSPTAKKPYKKGTPPSLRLRLSAGGAARRAPRGSQRGLALGSGRGRGRGSRRCGRGLTPGSARAAARAHPDRGAGSAWAVPGRSAARLPLPAAGPASARGAGRGARVRARGGGARARAGSPLSAAAPLTPCAPSRRLGLRSAPGERPHHPPRAASFAGADCGARLRAAGAAAGGGGGRALLRTPGAGWGERHGAGATKAAIGGRCRLTSY